jgi:hypothetical protein
MKVETVERISYRVVVTYAIDNGNHPPSENAMTTLGLVTSLKN